MPHVNQAPVPTTNALVQWAADASQYQTAATSTAPETGGLAAARQSFHVLMLPLAASVVVEATCGSASTTYPGLNAAAADVAGVFGAERRVTQVAQQDVCINCAEHAR